MYTTKHLGLLGLLIFTLLFVQGTHAQKSIRIGFYNCENLMDTIDDPTKRDDEFTPSGMKHWSSWKYYQKLQHLAKVIVSMGEWNGLAALGLAEVENRKVLTDLKRYSLLRKSNYEIVHFESPDKRGIDVALLYSPNQFTLVETKAIQVQLPNGSTTRDILYAKGVCGQNDTLSIFVNHWPSRWGGQIYSEHKRKLVAQQLLSWITTHKQQNERIIIMGDLNDSPTDDSVRKVLGAGSTNDSCRFVNLMHSYLAQETGTHCHGDEWNVLDHIIVSSNLLKAGHKPNCTENRAFIHRPSFLLKEENAQQSVFRSYRGAQYEGGFSDHLPVYINLQVN